MKKTWMTFSTVLLFGAITISSCNNSGDKKPAEDTTTTTTTTTVTTQETTPPVEVAKDIVDIAAGSADHSTLVAAVKAAGLVETLKGAGPFTVFAPTNAAFNALPAGTVDNLLKPENKADLTNVLTYHVVAGTLKAADLTNGQKLKTVQGTDLTVSIKDGKVMINGANVTAADLMASNGVIHVIDAVVLPKK
ncbi:MAG: fasciclin domain-containing protein [Chitinophagaceae bacterium]|nr:fasciclin domain-containing protein [Chitinophagaceae bacterium]